MTEKQKEEILDVAFKLVAIGDGAIGKTCLLVSFANKTFPTEYVPTVFDNYKAEVEYEGKTVDLSLWDTAGQEEYSRMRVLSYPDTHVFLILFSCVCWTSYENIITKWVPELLQEGDKKSKFILVCTKTDLREDEATINEMKEENGQEPISRRAGEKLAQEIGAVAYVETAAINMEGVNECFLKCVEVILHPPQGEEEEDKDDIDNKKKKKKKAKRGLFGSGSSSLSVNDDVSNFVGDDN